MGRIDIHWIERLHIPTSLPIMSTIVLEDSNTTTGTTTTLNIVCPNGNDGIEWIDRVGIAIAILGVLGGIVTFLWQQHLDRLAATEAKIKEDEDLDRQQALERVRQQMSVYVGPLQRLWKTQSTIMMHYMRHSGHGFKVARTILAEKGRAYWHKLMDDDFVQKFIDDPNSWEAVHYRNLVTRRLQPIYTRIRELILNHTADLADMPVQEEWLNLYSEVDIASPHNSSININVIFDTYVAWTFEYDDIIESWKQEDFRRMQPQITVAFMICNELIDLLYNKAKEKEAKYNQHVTVFKNEIQKSPFTGSQTKVTNAETYVVQRRNPSLAQELEEDCDNEEAEARQNSGLSFVENDVEENNVEEEGGDNPSNTFHRYANWD